MPNIGRGDFISIVYLFFIILIFNLLICLYYIYYFIQKVLFHNYQGKKLKLKLKKEKEVL